VIPYVCAAMGAETVILPEGKLRSRKGTSAPPSATPSVISEDTSNRSAADVDFIIVPDDAPKSRSKKNAEKTCNVEWVKQCLVSTSPICPILILITIHMLDHGQIISTFDHGKDRTRQWQMMRVFIGRTFAIQPLWIACHINAVAFSISPASHTLYLLSSSLTSRNL
jgi:hypothetical protein